MSSGMGVGEVRSARANKLWFGILWGQIGCGRQYNVDVNIFTSHPYEAHLVHCYSPYVHWPIWPHSGTCCARAECKDVKSEPQCLTLVSSYGQTKRANRRQMDVYRALVNYIYMLTMFDSTVRDWCMSVMGRAIFVTVRYLHFPETTESAVRIYTKKKKNAKGHHNAFSSYRY